MSDIRNYAFIDGNYLRIAYESSLRAFLAEADYRNLNLVALKDHLQASKVFYYDSIDEQLSDADDRRRFLDEVAALDGFHVRQGTTTGTKKRKRRQKKVDVHLAVDALTHAFNKNCWHISLVAGDLDFEPLVAALVQLGIHVHVVHEPRSAAKGLYRAADVSAPIDIGLFWKLSKASYRNQYPIPTRSEGNDHSGEFLRQSGKWQDKQVELYEITSKSAWQLLVRGPGYTSSFSFTFSNRTRLVEFFTLVHGSIEWDQRSEN